jgi:ribosome-associated toxin RatA of RatAB toxin-antitoxin module
MVRIERSALVPYTAEQMFHLVNRVERYPEFLRWCVGGEVRDETEQGMRASITVRVAGLARTFTTQNVLEHPHRISLNLVDGPFQALSGAWNFLPLGEDGSKVSLYLEFEFAGRVLSSAFAKGFSSVAEGLVSDFCNEAEQVYRVG